MVNNNEAPVVRLVGLYVVIALATVAALVVLSRAAPDLATGEAWGHAVIVAAFAVLLALRLRSARRGSGRARWAVGIIAAVLAVANLVEAALPGVFPGWMRVEMLGIAAVAALLAGAVASAGWLRRDRAVATR
jgi:peptidoglycan/LPS O-acetylase OafA/YrhL